MKKLSFVIPCYNSEHTIELVVDEIKTTVLSKQDCYTYEIVLVDDNSPDNVWQTIKKLCASDNKIKGINLAKNFGQHSALMAGYASIEGDYIITIDDDGQTPASEVFKLVDKIDEGFDVVYGYYEERKDNGFRKLGTVLNNAMSEILIEKPKNIKLTSYFIAKKFIISEIIKYTNPYPYIWGLVIRTTRNIANVTITHRQRDEGKSGYTFIKLVSLWVNGFTSFSVKPLRISTFVGFLCAVVGFIGGLVIIVMKLLYPPISAGYSSMMAALLFIGGMIMIMLGLIGEYIGRIYICINVSPQYVIKEIIQNVDSGAK